MASLSIDRSAPRAPASWHPGLQSVELNQDCSCVSAGGPHGFNIVELRSFRRHAFPLGGGIRICQMLECSSLVAIVGGGGSPAFSPRRVRIFNTSRNVLICEKVFDFPVVSVRMNFHCMLVMLLKRIHIFNIDTMEPTHRLDIAANPLGICCLQRVSRSEAGPSLSKMVLCYPASAEKGTVCVFDTVTQKVVHVIEAHQTPIQALALSQDGSFLATASTKATLIRIFHIDGPTPSEATTTFRRGVTSTKILSMRFNDAGTLLCVASSHGTIHIFPLVDLPDAETEGELGGGRGSGSTSSSADAGVLAQPTAAVAAAAATVSTAAHSIFSGLMTTLPTSLSSQRRTCAVNVEQGLSFTCGFLSNHTEAESVGVLCANRHEVVEGSNDETAQTKTSAYPTNGREMFPGANDHLVVVTSMGIVSLHRFNLMEGTSQLENQQFLLEQAE